MKIYIAGPMTGLPLFNRPAFMQKGVDEILEKIEDITFFKLREEQVDDN